MKLTDFFRKTPTDKELSEAIQKNSINLDTFKQHCIDQGLTNNYTTIGTYISLLTKAQRLEIIDKLN